jgi:DNA (cytosine-5)-methyltransferase 1
MSRNVRLKKIRRIMDGGRPRVLDLFAGCGGLSLGFHRACFDIVGALEIDPLAAASHRLNFHRPFEDVNPEALAKDITKIEPNELVGEFEGKSTVDDSVDVIVGGPPCQAFARVGRAKLRFLVTAGHFSPGLAGS